MSKCLHNKADCHKPMRLCVVHDLLSNIVSLTCFLLVWRAFPVHLQILSTHHCSRGCAKGSSLSICFLISRYEPWGGKAYKHVLFADIRMLFSKSQMRSCSDTVLWCDLYKVWMQPSHSGNTSNIRKWRKNRWRGKLILCNGHFQTLGRHTGEWWSYIN